MMDFGEPKRYMFGSVEAPDTVAVEYTNHVSERAAWDVV
jgi:hypothetical protein